MTPNDIKFLEEQGIINGVWPERYGKFLRLLMTWLFCFIDYKRHDINFWQQNWFYQANWGLLKYSFISIADNYREICLDKWYKKLYRIPKYYITLPFKAWIISLAYNAVESDKWLEAYNSIK
jgi:hypothetical protein